MNLVKDGEDRSCGGVVVIVRGPKGQTVAVLDPNREDPKLKFPGGGIKVQKVAKSDFLAALCLGNIETELRDKVLVCNQKTEEVIIQEKPTYAALRELLEETGLIGKPETLNYLGKVHDKKKTNYRYFYSVDVDDFSDLIPYGNDGEITKIIFFEEIEGLDFLSSHIEFIRYYTGDKSVQAA